MTNLRLGNSYSNITGLTEAQHKELSKLLSYQITQQAAFFGGGYKSSTRYLLSKRGDFASGLLYIVQNYLKTIGNQVNVIDARIQPIRRLESISLQLPYQPYIEQVEIANTAVKTHRGTISACTGFGKSLCMMLIVNELKVKTLIVVPNLELKRQLTDSFKQAFGDIQHITIENIDSKALKIAKDYDLLIIDEAHHSAAKTYRDLNKKAWGGIYYRFFFTATPFRSRDEEQLLFESIAGQVIYRIDYHQAVEKGYITPIEAYYIELPKVEPEGNIKSWPSMYSELVVNNEFRNQKISDLLLKLNDNNVSTLCLVKEIKHGNILKDMTDGFFASGINEDTPYLIQMFNNRKLNVLIGTTGVLGEGVDTRPTEYVIIAGLGKSKPQFMQQLGRAFRRFEGKESAKIILFKDPSHKYTINHFKEQCKVLRDEYGMGIIKLDI